jgi:hypothetical protein
MKAVLTKFAIFYGIITLFACGNGTYIPDEVAREMAALPEKLDYAYDVKPILSDRCFACHGPDKNKQKAGLRLDIAEHAYEKNSKSGLRAIVPGSLSSSELVARILSEDPEVLMPTPDSHLQLSPSEKAVLLKWIEQGAEYKPHWAFTKIQKTAPPRVEDNRWVRNDIDRFIFNKMDDKKLQPSPEADRETLLRRVALDLTGLPPTAAQVDSFVNDQSANAYEKVVDRLLASVHYGEQMAVGWLDVARYADTHGYQMDVMRTAWPYRDWVIKAFNENLPYDQFVSWQLAGDLLPKPTRDQWVATAFNRMHPQNQEGGIVEDEYRTEYVADRVNTFGKAFLGLTLECARCHDHKYDPISQKDYFSLFAYFNNINEAGQVPFHGESSPTIFLISSETETKLAEIKKKMELLEKEIKEDTGLEKRFSKWLKNVKGGNLPVAAQEGLVAHLTFDGEDRKTFPNLVNTKHSGGVGGDTDKLPEIVDGIFGKGRAVNGDGNIEIGNQVGFFERHEPFTISLWVKLQKKGIRGPVFSRSNGLDNGDRGYECLLNKDGTLSLHLTNNYPDNAVDIQTREPLLVGEWIQLVTTYDGSGSARGTHIYINGKRASVKVKADNLKKSMLYGPRRSNGFGLMLPFTIGAKFRDSMADFYVDELKIYNRNLSAEEVNAGFAQKPYPALTDQTLLRNYFVAEVDDFTLRKRKEIQRLRSEETLLYDACDEVMVMKEMKESKPAFLLQRGSYDAPGPRVQRTTPDYFFKPTPEMPTNRLGLAQWLLHPDHPLFTRVTVNRIWQHYFGKGLVVSSDDFGNQGDLPSHPELLDWLAVRLRELKWDMKAFQKMIVMSATYRQSSLVALDKAEADPDNRWYSRGPVSRMSAEQIRDIALASSGLLVDKVGGPSVYPYQPKGIWEALAASSDAPPYPEDSTEGLYRRSLYTIWKRTAPHPAMIIFDMPERTTCTVRRQKTSTPLQALTTLNDPQYVEAARVLAQHWLKGNQKSRTQEDFIRYAFMSVLGRPPRPTELPLLEQLYKEEYESFAGDSKRAWKLVRTGRYPVDRLLDIPRLAALTMVGNTVMNMDEAIIKR